MLGFELLKFFTCPSHFNFCHDSLFSFSIQRIMLLEFRYIVLNHYELTQWSNEIKPVPKPARMATGHFLLLFDFHPKAYLWNQYIYTLYIHQKDQFKFMSVITMVSSSPSNFLPCSYCFRGSSVVLFAIILLASTWKITCGQILMQSRYSIYSIYIQ